MGCGRSQPTSKHVPMNVFLVLAWCGKEGSQQKAETHPWGRVSAFQVEESLHEGKGKGASKNQKHAHKGMFLVFELRKACRHQKHVHVDAFLVSARGERLGRVSLDRRELGRCGWPPKTENTPRWACFSLCS